MRNRCGAFAAQVFSLALAAMLALAASSRAQAAAAVDVAGNTVHADLTVLGLGAELILTFDDAANLSPADIGIQVDLANPLDPLLSARLPALTSLTTALPLLITVEPRSGRGFQFANTARVEVHTHLLPYTAGSPLRLFKAPLGGAFVDITDEVAPGSVRTRGTTGGFSQFLVLVDLRDTDTVVAQKLARLRARAAALSGAEFAPVDAYLDATEAAIGSGDYAGALAALDALRAHVSARAGSGIPNTWSPEARGNNIAGDLLASAATLKFSIAFDRDFGD
jgi:hypothetical protein